jgi:hypothetical protein
VDDTLDELKDANFYTHFDLAYGFWQVRVRDHDIHKTAFQTLDGLMEWVAMPFGQPSAALTSMKRTNTVEFMWGVHNKRLLSRNISLKCIMCGQFTGNGHMAGNCPSMYGLQQDRHINNALERLLIQLESANGDGWGIITGDFGN